MGKTLLGGTSHEGNVNLLSPEAQQFLSSILGGQGGNAQGAYNDFLKPYSADQFQNFYQKSFIDPAQQALQRQVIPGIKENFLGLDESGSSALNRALAQSATDVSTSLGSGMLGQYNQYQNQRFNALQGLGGLAGAQTFQPLINQNQGILGNLLGTGATLGGAAIVASSKEYKENIRPLEMGLEALKSIKGYHYDYKEEYFNEKDLIGVMVEDCPKDLVVEKDGMKGVNMYGLVALMVNCINELRSKVDKLEAQGA